jgi:hypothetical protein
MGFNSGFKGLMALLNADVAPHVTAYVAVHRRRWPFEFQYDRRLLLPDVVRRQVKAVNILMQEIK